MAGIKAGDHDSVFDDELYEFYLPPYNQTVLTERGRKVEIYRLFDI